MRAIEKRLDQFCRDHPRFGIPNLMNILVIGTVIVFLLDRFSGYRASYLLSFSASAIFHGQIWRLVSFVFVPLGSDILTVALSLYFYWWIGSSLEREWGTARFSLFYLLGVVFNIVFGLIAGYTSVTYLNLSMFFAFAVLYPDMRVLLFFFIPIKIKWLALADALLFVLAFLSSLIRLDIVGAFLPLVSILNFFLFFWSDMMDVLQYRRQRYQAGPAAKGLYPQMRRLRQDRYRLPRYGVPLLFQVQRLLLLLHGAYQQPCPYRVKKGPTPSVGSFFPRKSLGSQRRAVAHQVRRTLP